MPPSIPSLQSTRPLTVGSLGDADLLASLAVDDLTQFCDLVEIRLDLLAAAGTHLEPGLWSHLRDIPLLFTARRSDEGGAGDFSAEARMKLLLHAIDDAALIDIEIASIPDMQPLVDDLKNRNTPWIASCHDFQNTPPLAHTTALRSQAAAAGATAFKVAAELGPDPQNLAHLTSLVQSPGEIPVSAMGMGPLAPVSRLLLAQLGSVLNYGYLGTTPTAPGQWSAQQLHQAIHSVDLLG